MPPLGELLPPLDFCKVNTLYTPLPPYILETLSLPPLTTFSVYSTALERCFTYKYLSLSFCYILTLFSHSLFLSNATLVKIIFVSSIDLRQTMIVRGILRDWEGHKLPRRLQWPEKSLLGLGIVNLSRPPCHRLALS